MKIITTTCDLCRKEISRESFREAAYKPAPDVNPQAPWTVHDSHRNYELDLCEDCKPVEAAPKTYIVT